MIGTYAIGTIGIIAMMLIWVAIQSAWRKVFSENITDDDVLAERRSCGNCGCTTICKKRNNK